MKKIFLILSPLIIFYCFLVGVTQVKIEQKIKFQ